MERHRAKGEEVTPDGRKKPQPDEEEGDSLTASSEYFHLAISFVLMRYAIVVAPGEEEFREDIREENPLLVKEAVAPPPNQTELWFSQSVFTELDDDDKEPPDAPEDEVDLEDEEEEEPKQKPKKAVDTIAKPTKTQDPKPTTNKRKREENGEPAAVNVPTTNAAFDKHGLFPAQKEKTAPPEQPKQKKPKMEEELSNRQKKAIEEHFDVVPVQRDFSR